MGRLNRVAVAALLTSGAPDVSLAPSAGPMNAVRATVTGLALQPDGQVLLRGQFSLRGSSGYQTLARISGSTGAEDLSFQPAVTQGGIINVLVQPGGKSVFVGQATISGQPDPAFTLTSYQTSTNLAESLTLDAAGYTSAAISPLSGACRPAT